MVRVTKVTPKKREQFLDGLAETASVTAAAKVTRITRKTWYKHRGADKEFAKLWEHALDAGTDALEDEAVRRGREGVLKPVFHAGKKVGSVREYSDTLLIVSLKARRPEKYRERVDNRVSGDVSVTIKHYGPTDTPE